MSGVRASRLRAVYAGLAVVDTALAASRRPAAHRVRRFTKPLLMPTLTASLVSDPRAAGSPLTKTTVAAQAAGWCGDVALLADEPRAFARGAAAFAAGHASYIAGMYAHRDRRRTRWAAAIALVWAVSAPTVAIKAGRHAPYLLPVLLGYSMTLAGTAATATMLGDETPRSARRRLVAGGLVFMASDAALGARRFLVPDAPPALEAVVMATYCTAQYLLADGAVHAAHDRVIPAGQ